MLTFYFILFNVYIIGNENFSFMVLVNYNNPVLCAAMWLLGSLLGCLLAYIFFMILVLNVLTLEHLT